MVGVLEIAVGDTVSIGGQAWEVTGSITFRDDDGWAWQEHLLASGDERRWLAVEDDDGVELVLWAPTNVTVEPGAHEMIHDGQSYRLDETGTASYVATGHTGTLPQGTLEYYDYAGRGGLGLSFERFDSSGWEMTAGTAVAEDQVQVHRG